MVLSTSPFLKNKTVWFALSLAMADAAAGTIANIYGYTIILSDYPAQSLIYYIVFQTLCTSVLRSIGLRFITNNYKKAALIQYLLFIIIFILSVALMQFKAYATPFIVAVITTGITSLSSIISWSMLSLSFGMREYKSVAKYCNQAAYLSSIISSFIIPLLVLFFSNTSLLFVATLMLAVCCFSIYHLPIQKVEPPPQKNAKRKSKSLRLPLYYYMMMFSILIATIASIAQYTMRLESADYFSHEQLSSFFGYFSGITNILGFLVATTSEHVLKRFGLKGLLNSIPFITLLCSLVVIFHPSFWSIIALGSIRSIFGFSYGNYSAEITFNILPPEIRFIAKANIKSTANIASMLLLVAFTIGKTDIHIISWWLPPLCLIALFAAYKITQYYKITLQQESAFKRYNILDEVTPATRPILEEISLNSLKSKDTYTVFYGLDLLAKLYVTEEPPQAVYALLSTNDTRVRSAVINFITEHDIRTALPFLVKRLPQETDNEIQFKIIEEIARQDISTAVEVMQKKELNEDFAPIVKNVYLFLQSIKKEKALHTISELSQNPKPNIRLMVASVIGTFKITELTEQLKDLIQDEEATVSEEALSSAIKLHSDALIPAIISLALQKKNSLAPQFAITALGSCTLPYLASEALSVANSKTTIKMIASIPGEEAEQTLLSLLANGTIYVRSLIAKYANERACIFLPSTDFKIKAHDLIKEESGIIFHLQKRYNSAVEPYIQTEIRLRIAAAKVRFLQWLAIATRPREVNQLISALLQDNEVNEQVLDKAIELLEIYIEDQDTRHYIDYIFENKTKGVARLLSNNNPDSWLEHIMNNPETQASLLSVVFELRAVRLFQDLPAEVLLALAEEIQYYNYEPDEVIFSKDDKPDGLYCVSQGEVSIIRDERIVTTIAPPGFFGELALLDEAPRVASAVAKTSCTIIYIEKDVFNRIADDVPNVLRNVVKIILEYTRKNLAHTS